MDGSPPPRRGLDETAPWATLGERFDITGKIFENRAIHEFVETDHFICVVAPKGMGKTVLLRKKRDFLEREGAGKLIIPGEKHVDFVQRPPSFEKSFSARFPDILFWKGLWESALFASIALNAPYDPRIATVLGDFADAMPRMLKAFVATYLDKKRPVRQAVPSTIVSEFLTGTYAAFEKFQRRAALELETAVIHNVRQSVHVLIDSFDQTLLEMCQLAHDRLDTDTWCAGQLGLLKAAWHINRHNPHIKIVCSVRSEAYANFRDDDRQAMHSAVLTLAYQRGELRRLVDVLVSQYENAETLDDFLGFSEGPGGEAPFDYMLRHTMARPRGLSVVGSMLHRSVGEALDPDERREQFARIVAEESPRDIVDQYLMAEMRHFLNFLDTQEKVEFIWRNLPANILSPRDLARITHRFAKRFGYEPESCQPFGELYNIGLLGHVAAGADAGRHQQRFRKTNDFSWNGEGCLPRSNHYLVHPALTHTIRAFNPQYRTHGKIRVGQDLDWGAAEEAVVDEDRISIFVSYSSRDGKLVSGVMAALEKQFDRSGVRHRFWRDVWRIKGGEDFQEGIEYGLKESDVLLLFYTRQSAQSRWVEREWRISLQREVERRDICVVPVTTLPPSHEMPPFLALKHLRRLPTSAAKTKPALKSFVTRLADDIVADRSRARG